MATGTLFGEMQAQASFVHATPLTEEFRPTWISDFVGLEKQKRVLSNLVKSPRCCALLFEGAPGTGKTSMAMAFANELLATIWHIGSQDCKVERLQEVVLHCNYVPKAGLKGFHVVIVDEADTMSDAAQKFLLSKLDSTGTVPNTIWIFTCNSSERLEERFQSRCLKLDFNSYGAASEITGLLSRIWKAKAPVSAEEPNLKKLACGNVRESLQRLEVALLSA
jgi:replication-associated recombination protein RarA